MSIESNIDLEFSAPEMDQEVRELLKNRLKSESNFNLSCTPDCMVELIIGLARWDIIAKNRFSDVEADDCEGVNELTSKNFSLTCCVAVDVEDMKRLTILISRWNSWASGSYKGGSIESRVDWHIRPGYWDVNRDKMGNVLPILRPDLSNDELSLEVYKKETERLGEWLQDLEGDAFIKN